MRSRKFIFNPGIALALIVVSGSVGATMATRDGVEARQNVTVWMRPALIPQLHANDPRVPMRNSEATLAGVVAEDTREMDNRPMLEIMCVAPVQPADQTHDEVLEDDRITTAVTSRLMWNKHTNSLTTHVYTNRGKVTLWGIAGSAAASNLASRLAIDTRGVLGVDNQLLVMGAKAADIETTPSPAHAVAQDIADRWITTKVKSTFMNSNSVDSARIAVSTSSGVVTLKGAVDSGTERVLAIELASSVRGVKSVQSEWFTPLIGQSLLKTAARPD